MENLLYKWTGTASWNGKCKNALEERIEMINQHFAQNLVDMHHPYLNPASEDIYQPLSWFYQE